MPRHSSSTRLAVSVSKPVPQPAIVLALSVLSALLVTSNASATTYPITPQERATAEQVAQAGVPESDLAADAPDTYTIKRHDTLWDISKLYLKTPWRWPELWGMNKEEIANPHLIYPGQVLMLVRRDGRAHLQLANKLGSDGNMGVVKLEPKVRSSPSTDDAIPPIPLELIEPFLTESVVFDTDALIHAPRIVATPESRTLLSQGDLAYARGNFGGATDFRLFRTATPLLDPSTHEILGYQATYVGTADLIREGASHKNKDGDELVVPATLKIRAVKLEVGVGDRLAPVEQHEFAQYVPHAPAQPISGQIVSVYGEAIRAGQNQIVALNRGSVNGMERGDVLALWKGGRLVQDTTGEHKVDMVLPDERTGVLFVFQVYKRVSYALIISAYDAIQAGDHFTQP